MVKPWHKVLFSLISFLLLDITLFPQSNNTNLTKLMDLYNEVKAFASTADGPIPTRVVAPPVMHFDYCYPCDKARQAEYSRDAAIFVNTYLHPERQYIDKANEVISGLKVQVAFTDLAPEKIEEMKTEMFQAIIKISERSLRRLTYSWETYKDDARRNILVAELLLTIIRWLAVISLEPPEGTPGIHEIVSQVVNSGLRYMEQAKEKRDYPVLLNYKKILGLYKVAELIGISLDELETSIFKFVGVNRFKMSVETSSRSTGSGGAFQNAQLSAEGVFLATPDSNCQLQWKLIGPDSVRFHYKLEAIEMKINPGGHLAYTGTESYYSPPPELKLGFCEQNRDTAHFYGFAPRKEGKENWKVKDRIVEIPFMVILYTMGFNDPQQYGREAYRKDTVNRYAKVQYGFLLKHKLVNWQKVVFDKHIDGRTHAMLPTAWFRARIEHEK